MWGEWTQWSYCSKSCVGALGLDNEALQEGGIRSRRRHVLTAWCLWRLVILDAEVPNHHGRPTVLLVARAHRQAV